MSAFLPPWGHDGGTAKLIERLRDPAARPHPHTKCWRRGTNGTTSGGDPGPGVGADQRGAEPVAHAVPGQDARRGGQAPEEGYDRDAARHPGRGQAYTYIAVFGMSEPDIALAMKQPWTSVDKTRRARRPTVPWTRSTRTRAPTGPFPGSSGSTCARSGCLSLEDAIRKLTSLPAQPDALADRGVLKEGMSADMVVFDPDSVRDKATFAEPNQLAEGMVWVLVNGVPVIADGKATGALPGRVLRGPGSIGESKVESRKP